MLLNDVPDAVIFGAEAELADGAAIRLATAAVVQGSQVMSQQAIVFEVNIAIFAHGIKTTQKTITGW